MYAASSHPSTSLWPPPASHYAPQMPGMEGGQRGAGEWQPACSEVQSSSWKNWKRTGNFPARVHQSEGWARACSPTASHGFSIVSMRNKKTSSDAGQCVLFRFSFFVFFCCCCYPPTHSQSILRAPQRNTSFLLPTNPVSYYFPHLPGQFLWVPQVAMPLFQPDNNLA